MSLERAKILLNQAENIQLEYKEYATDLPENLFETICAMLNRDGGDILLGVDDDGWVTESRISSRAMFSIQLTHREIATHLAAWLGYLGFQVLAIDRFEHRYAENLWAAMSQLPAQLIFTYTTLYGLIPAFLLKKERQYYLFWAAIGGGTGGLRHRVLAGDILPVSIPQIER